MVFFNKLLSFEVTSFALSKSTSSWNILFLFHLMILDIWKEKAYQYLFGIQLKTINISLSKLLTGHLNFVMFQLWKRHLLVKKVWVIHVIGSISMHRHSMHQLTTLFYNKVNNLSVKACLKGRCAHLIVT